MKYILYLLLFVSIFSCGKSDDDLRKIEQKKMMEQLDNTKIQLYKSMKIALRSTAIVGQNPELDNARKNMFALVGNVLGTASSAIDKDETTNVNPLEVIQLAKSIYDEKETLLKTNEDSLPTLLGNIFYVFTQSTKITNSSYLPITYNNNHEHIILSLLWQITPSAPKDFAMYEVYKSDEKDIEDVSLKLVYQLTKSFVLLNNEYYFHSLDKCNEYLDYMEKNKQLISQTPVISLTEGSAMAREQSYYQLHGMGLIIKALDENKLGKKKESLDGMELFLSDMEKGGLDNELTWLTSSYVFISKEEFDKAIPSLQKLEKSNLISEPEKKSITELLGFIKSRKKDSALNLFTDKLAFSKIAFHLFQARIKESKQLSNLSKSKEGKKLMQIQEEMNDKLKYIVEAKQSLNTDSLASKAKGFLNGLLK
jgi:hypothetical protein